jgi:hypothetical protein
VLWGEFVVQFFYDYCIILTQYCSGDEIEKNEIGRACGAYGGDGRRIQGFGGET